jgi:hypothetical protein
MPRSRRVRGLTGYLILCARVCRHPMVPQQLLVPPRPSDSACKSSSACSTGAGRATTSPIAERSQRSAQSAQSALSDILGSPLLHRLHHKFAYHTAMARLPPRSIGRLLAAAATAGSRELLDALFDEEEDCSVAENEAVTVAAAAASEAAAALAGDSRLPQPVPKSGDLTAIMASGGAARPRHHALNGTHMLVRRR